MRDATIHPKDRRASSDIQSVEQRCLSPVMFPSSSKRKPVKHVEGSVSVIEQTWHFWLNCLPLEQRMLRLAFHQ